jgi:FkbM family methyltransferase
MSSTLKRKILGKVQASKVLLSQFRHFSNWSDVFRAYRAGQRLPPLRLRSGMTLHHRPADPVWSLFQEIFVNECYTRDGFYRPKSVDSVLDLGANIGTFSLYLQSVARGIRIHCYEPSRETRAQLEKNLTENGLLDFVTVHPFAITNREESRTLYFAGQSGSNSLFLDQVTEGGETVQCRTLAQAVEGCGGNIDLLKIDTEGAEVEILDNVDPETWTKIQRVVLEYHEDVRPGCHKIVMDVLSQHYSKIRTVPMDPAGLLGVIQASN